MLQQGDPEPEIVEVEVIKPVEVEPEVDPEELRQQHRKFMEMLADRNQLEKVNKEQAAAVHEMATDLMEAHQLSDRLLSWSLERGAEQLVGEHKDVVRAPLVVRQSCRLKVAEAVGQRGR